MAITSDKDWYYEVINNWDRLSECLSYFSTEAGKAKYELKMAGKIEDNAKTIPAITEIRFTQLQILNAILRYFEIQLDKERSVLYKKYLENYNRQLTSRDIEKYIDGEESVVSLSLLINEISLVRNAFLSIMKGLENKSFTINNIVRLRQAGLDDAIIE